MTVSSMIARWSIPVTVQTKSSDSLDATGSRVETYAAEITTAFVQIRGNSDGVAGAAERSTRVAVVYFPGRKVVAVRDRLGIAGGTFEITSVRVPDERATIDPLCYTIVDAVEVFG